MGGEVAKPRKKSEIRVSDHERERAVETLRLHFAAGRLESDELEERIALAYDARTRGDLKRLLADLPSDRGQRMARRTYESGQAAWRCHLGSYVGVNGGLVALWAATGGGEFWPMWPMGGWGIGLAAHGFAWRAAARGLRQRLGGRELGDRRPPPALSP
jgi:hypothetical protein